VPSKADLWRPQRGRGGGPRRCIDLISAFPDAALLPRRISLAIARAASFSFPCPTNPLAPHPRPLFVCSTPPSQSCTPSCLWPVWPPSARRWYVYAVGALLVSFVP